MYRLAGARSSIMIATGHAEEAEGLHIIWVEFSRLVLVLLTHPCGRRPRLHVQRDDVLRVQALQPHLSAYGHSGRRRVGHLAYCSLDLFLRSSGFFSTLIEHLEWW